MSLQCIKQKCCQSYFKWEVLSNTTNVLSAGNKDSKAKTTVRIKIEADTAAVSTLTSDLPFFYLSTSLLHTNAPHGFLHNTTVFHCGKTLAYHVSLTTLVRWEPAAISDESINRQTLFMLVFHNSKIMLFYVARNIDSCFFFFALFSEPRRWLISVMFHQVSQTVNAFNFL